MKLEHEITQLGPSHGCKVLWRLEIPCDLILWRGTAYSYASARRRMAQLVRGWRRARRQYSATHPLTGVLARQYSGGDTLRRTTGASGAI